MITYKKDYLIATAIVPHSEWDSKEWTDIEFMNTWNKVFPNRTIVSLNRIHNGYEITFSVLCDEDDEILE